MKRTDPELKQFVDERLPPFYRRHPYGSVQEHQLISAVLNDRLFGFLEVDIHVPEYLQKYFEEMPPLFCTTDVDFQDIGPYMQSYARQRGMTEKPRRLLISGMKARQILLSTPYLNGYSRKDSSSPRFIKSLNTHHSVASAISSRKSATLAEPEMSIRIKLLSLTP